MKKLFFALTVLSVLAQSSASAQRWKRQRYEFSVGIGASNFLGELGGANQIGTNYFKDLEWSQTRLALAVGLPLILLQLYKIFVGPISFEIQLAAGVAISILAGLMLYRTYRSSAQNQP